MNCLLCGNEDHKHRGEKNGYGIVECEVCTLHFATPTPTQAELDALYGAYAPNIFYSKKTSSKIARTKRRLMRYMHMAPGKRFLDAGCNIGARVEAERLVGLDAHGIDIGQESISSARNLSRRPLPRWPYGKPASRLGPI